MNIKQAKEQIKNAMTAYFEKDEFGEYLIPEEEQRPVFLLGPPGVGKTAIMAQIAQELGVGLVSYSMTHHTRQSALGLPFIEKKNYGGKEYSVSEYTMSEIIASVYDLMEDTGVCEGILFIDEINCVSETLAPSMLQFLQYKMFGKHKVPHGWIVVTAGNPPEYNNSVREFDIVTWDRLKVVNVEPDFKVWKEYAYKKGVHASVMSYLDIKKADFYLVETTVDGKNYVTARGWTDLSNMIHLYERKNIKVDEQLVFQYIRHKKTAKEFAVYYDLWLKYKSDYQISDILAGNADESIKERARAAKFDERISLLGLLLDGLGSASRDAAKSEYALIEYVTVLKEVSKQIKADSSKAVSILSDAENEVEKRLKREKRAAGISADMQYALHECVRMLKDLEKKLTLEKEKSADDIVKADFKAQKAAADKLNKNAEGCVDNLFKFCDDCFGDGQESVILVAEITSNPYTANLISRTGNKTYYKHNKEMLFYTRNRELAEDILKLGLDDENE